MAAVREKLAVRRLSPGSDASQAEIAEWIKGSFRLDD
jgi:hypothetical protein